MGDLFDHCTKQDTLHKAWRRIRANGARSKADETRKAIEDFEQTINRNISRIQRRLRDGTFEFDPQQGVLKTKSSGGKRGIVMASVHNRVVERSLLDTLQQKVTVARQAGRQPSSFGGVPDRSVPHALKFLSDAFESGHTFFVRSDISGFFDGIPRKAVLASIGQDTDDERFLKLLLEATTVTLGNEKALVLQVFGVNDVETAKWLSQTLGKETIGYETATHRPGDLSSSSEHVTGRELLTPDEIMRLPQSLQLLRLQGMPPVLAAKLRYYADTEFDGLYAKDAA